MKRHDRERYGFALIEPIVTIIVVLFLYFPLNKKDLAELTGIFGGLVAVANIAQTHRLRREFSQLERLAETVDLTQSADIDSIRELLRLYVSIKEPEFAPLKDDAVEHCSIVLARLAHDRVSSQIDGTEYHIWLANMLAKSSTNKSHVRAISTMNESDWLALPAEKKFLDANIEAAKRGAIIERIFVTTRERFSDPDNQRVVAEHVRNAQNGLTAYIAWADDLAKQDVGLLQDIGDGFISFGDRVALVDVSVPPDEARGIVTMNQSQLKRLRRIFDRLQLHAEVARQDHLITSNLASKPKGNLDSPLRAVEATE